MLAVSSCDKKHQQQPHFTLGFGQQNLGRGSTFTLLVPSWESLFLVVVNAHSKWPEVCKMASTTPNNTSVLCDLFASHGLPEQILSDSGPQFTSEEFKQLTKGNSHKRKLSAPYHPPPIGGWVIYVNLQASYEDK